MKTVLILDSNKLKYIYIFLYIYMRMYIYIFNLSCSGRKVRSKKPILLQKKNSTHLLRLKHFKILPETIHCCPTKTSSSW